MKFLKSIVSFSLVIAMLLVTFSSVCAAEINSQSVGETLKSGNYKYELLENGTARITGYTGKEADLTIPSTLDKYKVTVIASSSFGNNSNIVNVTIPDSVTTIENSAFYMSYNMRSVTISKSVTEIGELAFQPLDYSSLEKITVNSKNAHYSSVNGVLFNKNKSQLLVYPPKKTSTSYALPSGVEVISPIYNEYLQLITLSEKVAVIEKIDCANLKEFSVSADNETFSSENGVLLNKNKTAIIKYPQNKQDSTYTMPNSVEWISDYAFANCKMKKVIFSNSLSCINSYAFDGCFELTEADIPDNVNSIGDGAFYNCYSIEKLHLPENLASIGYGTFYDCSSIKSLEIPENVSYIGERAFQGCESMTSLSIGNNVKTIDFHAFYRCSSLENVTIPKGVTAVNSNAFNNCANLKNITIFGKDTTLGRNFVGKSDELTISGYPQSTAQIYAENNFIKFNALTLKGDVNGDGIVNVVDATEIQKFSVGLVTLSESAILSADVNGDDVVNVSDATMIQKQCVGFTA